MNTKQSTDRVNITQQNRLLVQLSGTATHALFKPLFKKLFVIERFSKNLWIAETAI